MTTIPTQRNVVDELNERVKQVKAERADRTLLWFRNGDMEDEPAREGQAMSFDEAREYFRGMQSVRRVEGRSNHIDVQAIDPWGRPHWTTWRGYPFTYEQVTAEDVAKFRDEGSRVLNSREFDALVALLFATADEGRIQRAAEALLVELVSSVKEAEQ